MSDPNAILESMMRDIAEEASRRGIALEDLPDNIPDWALPIVNRYMINLSVNERRAVVDLFKQVYYGTDSDIVVTA